jgi:tetratricopeptide (TPR) repeat protein
MKPQQYIKDTLRSLSVILLIFLSGCMIFRPVGHAISQGYENTVTYFNGYYNAKWLFTEAEDEIQADIILKRGQKIQPGLENQIPSGTKDKLTKVIDKCSNILAFHSSSTLVDDALLLIGKSFYYQAEYLKAERKFAELIAQYPDSPLILETQIWYARTEEKLKKYQEGIQICDSTIAAAHSNGEIEIEMQARQLLGNLYLSENQPEKAVTEYEMGIALTSHKDIKAEMQMSLGSIYFSQSQFEKAAHVYLRVGEYTSDQYLNYFSALQAAIAYRKMKEFKKGISLLDAMIQNFRYKPYLPELLFERANNYAESGMQKDAIDEYVYIDTTYTKSEYAAQSAYQLGVLFEKDFGDYRSALKYYAQVNPIPGSTSMIDGQSKYKTLTRYFAAQNKLGSLDSLLTILSDTTKVQTEDSVVVVIRDTSRHTADTPALQYTYSRTDSVAQLTSLRDSLRNKMKQGSSLDIHISADSLKTLQSLADKFQRKIDQISLQPIRLSADSVMVFKSLSAEELGDIFYSELSVPDSAFYWYNKSLVWNYHPTRSPRVLYILAELSRIDTSKKFSSPEEYYSRLDRDFPGSLYAEEARRFLGKASRAKRVDTAKVLYDQAEKYIEQKQYKNAIPVLHSITQFYSLSPYASQSEYTLGWIYEHGLRQPDSAMTHYRRVLKNHGGTRYAVAAASKSLVELHPDTIKIDTASIHAQKIDSSRIRGAKPDTVKASSQKIDRMQNQFLPRDTSKVKPMKYDSSQTNPSRVDSMEIRMGQLNRRGKGQKNLPQKESKRDSI